MILIILFRFNAGLTLQIRENGKHHIQPGALRSVLW